MYLTAKRGRQRCPVMLLVVCVDAGTARWCRQPIELGHPGFTLTPLVFGPEQVPVVDDIEMATPEVAVFSAMAHGAEHPEVLTALVGALARIDPNRAELYGDVVLAALPMAAQQYLEELMAANTYQFQSNFARRYFGRGKEEGMAEGEAEAIILFLDARGIVVPPHMREQIMECHDLDQLRIWVRRAATVATADALFA